jgi:hypothetical protein
MTTPVLADQGHIPTREEFRRLGPQWEAGWVAGCHAEAAAYREGMSKEARELRGLLEAFARLRPDASVLDLLGVLWRIYTAGQPWWRRLLLIWRWRQ